MKNLTSNIQLRCLILAGLFVALDIVATRLFPAYFLPHGTFLFRVGPQFLIFALAGWTIGPGWALGMAMTADVVGVLINPTGTGQAFVGFTLTAGLSGLSYGLFLHRHKPSIFRVLAAVSSHMLVIALPLTSLWFYLMGLYPSFLSTFWLALPWRAIAVIPFAVILFALQKALAVPVEKLCSTTSQ